MSPKDVQGDFLGPSSHVWITFNKRRQSIWGNLSEGGQARFVRRTKAVHARQTVKAVVKVQLLHNVWRLERVDNDDGLASAIKTSADELINTVGTAHLIRIVTSTGTETHLACEESIIRTRHSFREGVGATHHGRMHGGLCVGRIISWGSSCPRRKCCEPENEDKHSYSRQ